MFIVVPDIPFAKYDDPIVEAAIDQRRKFFEAKLDHLYQVEIFYCILLELGAEFTGIFTNADGNLFAETYNQLNAYFATVPDNYALNLRKLYLLNTNYADLSFLFTILPGEKTNAHLGTEYLAVLETDNSTPYYLNLHTGDVAHTLILGMSGSGNSFLRRYAPQRLPPKQMELSLSA